jgi:UTP--glucose-1-phosphate uridylyltransferase
VVEEAIQTGLTEVVFINNQTKTIIEDHFDHNWVLEELLERKGKTELLAEIRAVAEMANIISVRQKKQLGLGHAVLCAQGVINDDPFAVMVGDDLMFGMEPGIKQLVDVARAEGLSVVGVVEVPRNKVDRYGIIQGEEFAPGIFRVNQMVEKPAVADAPSRMAVVGRYVLMPEVFEHLRGLKPGVGGEIQLTDALEIMAKENRLLAVRMRGRRFDAGDWAEYLTANIYFALQDEELRDDVVRNLQELLSCK